MNRLCERPGCSERASVAYGMRPEHLVFWLDLLDDDNADGGRLCLRHADSMSVPRGWTLDDLRDPDLHLFRPPSAAPSQRRGRRAQASDDSVGVEQLALDGVAPAATSEATVVDTETRAAPETQPAAETETAPETEAESESETETDPATGGAADESDVWAPSFDQGDDLDGLLSARSPLLARAFRGNDRPRS